MERRLTEDELELLAAVGRGPDGRSTDIASGGGPPHWVASMLNYCSRCGAELEMATLPEESRDRLACASCGYIAYVNPRLVVTTLPVTPAGRAHPAAAGDRAGPGLVGTARRVPRG